MVELFRSNNPVELLWARTVLEEAGLESFIFDLNINFLEGNIGAFPRRLMVAGEGLERARDLLARARRELEREPLPDGP